MACSVSEKVCRPAAKRMIALGRTIRAVATVRNTVCTDTGYDHQSHSPRGDIWLTSFFSKGVPSMGTRVLTGKDSGCSGSLILIPQLCSIVQICRSHLDTSWMRPTRSSSCSPSPRIPPEHTEIPASRTAASVLKRSS